MARKPASGSEELLHLQMMEFQCFLRGLPNEYCRERQFVSQLGALAEGERFEPPVRFHVLSKPPATQNLSQNTDGYAFAR